ncbi:MAG: DNA-directed RNA polymerase subunit beta'', partial [bacterium]|nr:DNA-directed RNA polymerase subunit beta'' [bacterium]
IVAGKELTIVIASIQPSNAVFEQTKKEQIWHVPTTDEKYIVKCPIDTTVENGMIIAELIDDEHKVMSSGEIRYNGIEVGENQVVTKGGEVIFIPEEIHQISKDSSLKLVESGTYVEAGTEVVKDLYTHIDGIVEIKEFNDIIHEVVVRPGELHTLDSINDLKVDENEVVRAGTVVAGKIKAKVDSIVTIVENDTDMLDELDDLDEDITEDIVDEDTLDKQQVQILIRPVQSFVIEPRDVSIEFETTDEAIEIVPLTQLQFKDGARVRSLDGAVLTRTSLVLSMSGYLSHSKGLVELDKTGDLKIVVLETLIVRREQDDASRTLSSMQTELLVENGQIIEPRTPVTKTQVLSIDDSIASIKQTDKDLRRLLLVSAKNEQVIPVKGKATVKVGDFVKLDAVVASSGETTKCSGRVIEVGKDKVVVRIGRPHLISPGTLLQVENNALILRGDLLATLVFERQKTGDIVQGLPRVEELLEARKPKDSAIVAEEDGVAEIEIEDDVARLYIVNENGRTEIKYPIESSVIVSDKQKIVKGQALTSGPLNPHDVIRLRGANAAQQYLVDEVQRVYRSQGVEIADKHVEVIVRQMIKKVKVLDSGTTKLLPGELVELKVVEAENAKINEAEGGIKATYEALLLGITKASLNTESFISAASFQETTRILTEAAVEGKKDLLRGLKENVIIGRLIPAGTGYHHLINASEEKEKEALRRAQQKNQARKPSAILEEIEGMFGTPDFTIE